MCHGHDYPILILRDSRISCARHATSLRLSNYTNCVVISRRGKYLLHYVILYITRTLIPYLHPPERSDRSDRLRNSSPIACGNLAIVYKLPILTVTTHFSHIEICHKHNSLIMRFVTTHFSEKESCHLARFSNVGIVTNTSLTTTKNQPSSCPLFKQ